MSGVLEPVGGLTIPAARKGRKGYRWEAFVLVARSDDAERPVEVSINERVAAMSPAEAATLAKWLQQAATDAMTAGEVIDHG